MRLHILMLLSLSLIVSCGKSKGKGSNSSSDDAIQNETVQTDGSNIQGIYATTLLPLNNNIYMQKIGAAAVQRDGDVFSAYVKVKYGQRMTTLKQSIYTGKRCPTIADDLNKDAYVDIQEALIAIGKVIIPLDGSLDSQFGGQNVYPTGDSNLGSFMYKSTGSFARMFADLKSPDDNTADMVTKLKDDEGLALQGRIVLLQGINERVFLPPTAISLGDRSVYKTIPVACGVLKKVKKMPPELTEVN